MCGNASVSKARSCIRLHNGSQVDTITIVCIAEVWLIGGKSWECVIQAEEYRLTRDEGLKTQQKQLSYSFIINTNIHTHSLHILFLCRLCLILGGAAQLERPEHLPAAQISPLHHQPLSIYCKGKKDKNHND